ncbi:hypothetical protein BH11BAC3_BH11BAC3_12070 [soil metagenome]
MATYLKNAPRSILWFKQIHDRGELEMKPPFQRNPVWTVKQKSYLIDSILNQYPVPEIYMQEIVTDKGEVQYVLVDGQQRIRASLEFVNNEFEIDPKDSPQWGNLSFEELKPEEKKRIYEYDFIARYLPDIPDAELRAIFQRLNSNNIVLNSQELRQATYWGPFIETMNDLADVDLWRKVDVFTNNDIKRMLDVEFISELAVGILHGLQNKKLSLDKYYELYEREFPERSKLKEVFDVVLREIVFTIPLIPDTRWSKKTDFYTLFLLLAKKREFLPLSQTTRERARNILYNFGENVDKFVTVEKQEGDNSTANPNIQQYALNLRASSDLGARKKREEALENELNVLFPKENNGS